MMFSGKKFVKNKEEDQKGEKEQNQIVSLA